MWVAGETMGVVKGGIWEGWREGSSGNFPLFMGISDGWRERWGFFRKTMQLFLIGSLLFRNKPIFLTIYSLEFFVKKLPNHSHFGNTLFPPWEHNIPSLGPLHRSAFWTLCGSEALAMAPLCAAHQREALWMSYFGKILPLYLQTPLFLHIFANEILMIWA